MNKGRRQELAKYKFRKRLKTLGLKPINDRHFKVYKSTGKPCSCFICSHYDKAILQEKKAKNKTSSLMQDFNDSYLVKGYET